MYLCSENKGADVYCVYRKFHDTSLSLQLLHGWYESDLDSSSEDRFSGTELQLFLIEF